ncbi:MAG: response regulator, partial [Acidobacteriota bacterium]|nr:response regulator [Acidobacteriota bacterium]
GGLELARRERVGVVITDLRLPDISGLDVLGALRREWPLLPVVLITSHGTPELFADALRAGATAVLPKPFAPDEIIRLVEGFD